MAPASRKKPKPVTPPPAVKYSPQAVREYERGLRLFHDGKFAEAREVFLALRGQAEEPDFKAPAGAYQRACEARLAAPPPEIPRDPDGLYQQAVLRTNDGMAEEAIRLLEKARSAAPKDDRILYLLAVNHFRRGERQRALELLGEAIRQRDQNRELARNDPEFEEIWEDRDFLQVVVGES